MSRHREGSLAPSEPEADILDALYFEDAVPGDSEVPSGQGFDVDGILDGRGEYNDDDEDGDGDAAFIALQQSASFRKAANLKGKSVKKGGGFQAMGLSANVLKAITRKGFSVPTPIQRKTVPLILDRKDVVGMARTGSGKTAAFVIPMIERLRAHSATFGARGLILSPSRELAIQTLKVVKDFSRGTDIKSVLLVGGDNLEEQFGLMSANPDIVIATPGRFLHLKVEMNLDLSSIRYVVFDEADRLFEMGFEAQLAEILHALPASRQTLLFSATLPASLVEFARAGLQDPTLVRLDAETKVSPDLECAYFSVKGAEKEGSLLHILQDVIKIPPGAPGGAPAEDEKGSRKRKRGSENAGGKPAEQSTIIFTATKHHVEYLYNLLQEAGYACSHVYGSLDQAARRIQVEDFRRGKTNILVVTDVAARGIDIPILANVINYDFPPQPKIFVHRVGRTARAGRRGWSYSLVRDTDAPYLLDLQLFLGRQLIVGQSDGHSASFATDVVVGALKRDDVEASVEWVDKVLREKEDVNALRRVAGKAEKLYLKTRNSASLQSAKRAKELVASEGWGQLHQLFGREAYNDEHARAIMLAKIGGFKPQETIFEVGHGDRATRGAAEVMKQLRERMLPNGRKSSRRQAAEVSEDSDDDNQEEDVPQSPANQEMSLEAGGAISDDDIEDDELEVTVTNSGKSKKGRDDWQDKEIFMGYTPRTTSAAEEKGYGVHSGGASQGSFVEAARNVAMDLANDEAGSKAFGVPSRQKMRWDSRSKKYVSRDNDEDGSKGAKMITGESGVKIAASFQSGRFDKWKRTQRIGKLPRIGEAERPGASGHGSAGSGYGAPGGGARGGHQQGGRFKHKQEKAPKEADKYRDDFYMRKKRVDEAREKRVGRFRDGMGSKKELKGAEQIRKARGEKQKKKAKNARPMRRKS